MSTTADILYDLLNTIWESEVALDEWKKGLLIKVPKKGQSLCKLERYYAMICFEQGTNSDHIKQAEFISGRF